MITTDLGRAGGLPPAPRGPALPSPNRRALGEERPTGVGPTTSAGGGSRSSLDSAPPAGLTVYGSPSSGRTVDWPRFAACADTDPELFFPDATRGYAYWRQVAAAKAVCEPCTVKYDCLLYALVHRITDGIWGATTVEERKRMAHGLRFCATCTRPFRIKGAPSNPVRCNACHADRERGRRRVC